MSGRPGRAGRGLHGSAPVREFRRSYARAEVTVVDVTAAYWLGPLLTELDRRVAAAT